MNLNMQEAQDKASGFVESGQESLDMAKKCRESEDHLSADRYFAQANTFFNGATAVLLTFGQIGTFEPGSGPQDVS